MKEWLLQIVPNVVQNEKVAGSVSAVSAANVVSYFFNLTSPLFAAISLFLSIALAYTMWRNRIKKGKLMDKELILMSKEITLKEAQIKAISERVEERGP